MPPETTAPAADGQGAPISGAAILTSTPAAPPVALPAAPAAWMAGLDETAVNYLQNKNWSNPADILNAYRGAEKFISAPISQRAVIPTPDAKPEEWNAFYNQLGRPADPAGYKIEVPAVGGDPEFAKQAAVEFHKAGLTTSQAESLSNWFNVHVGGLTEAQKTQQVQDIQRQQQELTSEWGAALQQNTVQAQTAVRALGLDKETLEKIEGAIGYKATMSMFQKIGSKSGEPDFVSGKGNEGFSNIPTPVQAKAKIAELRADKNFVARYFAKDAAAVAEMARLHEFANPVEKR